MNQLTIRGFDAELTRRIQLLAKREGLSLNQAALKLMRRGAGVEAPHGSYQIGDRILKYAGFWSEDDFEEFEQATASFG